MDKEDREQFSKLRQTNSTDSAQSTSHPLFSNCSPQYAMERARLMFGCYRRGDANDPDIYVAAVTAVLARYPAEIVKAVTDPCFGLPSRKTESGWSGLPDVADVKAACEAEAERAERLKKYAELPRTEFKRLRPPPAGPGAWATILVLPDAPQYPRMVEVIKTADARMWKHDENGRGIWVSYHLLDRPLPAKAGFTRLTDEQLRAAYPPREPAEAAE